MIRVLSRKTVWVWEPRGGSRRGSWYRQSQQPTRELGASCLRSSVRGPATQMQCTLNKKYSKGSPEPLAMAATRAFWMPWNQWPAHEASHRLGRDHWLWSAGEVGATLRTVGARRKCLWIPGDPRGHLFSTLAQFLNRYGQEVLPEKIVITKTPLEWKFGSSH